MRFTALSVVSLALFACGGQQPEANAPSAAAPSAPTPTAPAAAPTKTAGVDTAALEKLTAEEAKSGSCDPDHKAALEKFLQDGEQRLRQKQEDGKPLKIESLTRRVLALSEAAKGVQLTLSGKGTEVHVIAVSPKELSLDVLAGTQAATTMRSSYKADLSEGAPTIQLPKVGGAVPLEGDSRQIEMKPGTPLDVRMRGKGCAGLIVFSKGS
jgi:hypothetical protein